MKLTNAARNDLIIIIIVLSCLFLFELIFNAFTEFAEWLQSIQAIYLAEIVTMTLAASIAASIYAWRRWQESVKLMQTQAQLVESVNQAEGENQRYRNFAEAVSKGQEEERLRLARELHDDTIHRLILISQKAQLTEFEFPDNLKKNKPDRVETDLKKIGQLTDETINNVRRFIQELRPSYLEELGLIPALKELAREKAERTGIDIRFEQIGSMNILAKPLDEQLDLLLYRVSQVALRNVALHAEATEAILQLTFDSDKIMLDVTDNGIGFELPDKADLLQHTHYGLMGMQERASLNGAEFDVNSTIGEGTKVSVVIHLV